MAVVDHRMRVSPEIPHFGWRVAWIVFGVLGVVGGWATPAWSQSSDAWQSFEPILLPVLVGILLLIMLVGGVLLLGKSGNTLQALDSAPDNLARDHADFLGLLRSSEARLILQRMLSDPTLEKLAVAVTMRAPLPPLHENIVRQLRVGTTLPQEIAEMMGRDQSLATDLMRMLNSGCSGLPDYLTQIDHAVALLPRELLEGLILLRHAQQQFAPPAEVLSSPMLAQHSMVVGTFAQALCVDELASGASADALRAGLLHDVGKLVLASQDTPRYRIVLSQAAAENIPLFKAEEQMLGIHHGEVAAFLLDLWGVPAPALIAARDHHHPNRCMSAEFSVTVAVHVADALANELAPRWSVGVPANLDEEFLTHTNRARRVSSWRGLCRARLEQLERRGHHKLAENDRATVRAWGAEFDRHWDENLLATRMQGLPPIGSPLRLPSIIELVRIDMKRHWMLGRQRTVEEYTGLVPDLARVETFPAQLIQMEFDLRQQFDAPMELTVLDERFPLQAEEVRRLLAEAARGAGQENTKLATLSPIATSSELAAATEGSSRRETAGAGMARGSSWPQHRHDDGPVSHEIPEEFGRYRILGELGKGGMGAVYLALDVQLDRQVALKVPHFGETDGAEALKLFLQEARAAAKLSHPSICPIHDVGQVAGIPYFTMPFIAGKSLGELCAEKKPMPGDQAARLVRLLALALEEAHQNGVIHRDLKPGNIMMNHRGEPVIMDFGLARRLGRRDDSISGRVGTPAYMAPEQVRADDKAIGPATDIYSLGIIFFELLTGRLPFTSEHTSALYMQIVTEAIPLPSHLNPAIDARLESVCLKATAKLPPARYSSMNEFALALEEALVPAL